MYHIAYDLYDYIFYRLGACHERRTEEVENNLENSREMNQVYLGTYFPRSFVESHKIFTNVFECFKEYSFNFDADGPINVLDVGSGTGGELFALLRVLSARFEHQKINVYSIEGNQDALDIQKNIVDYNNGALYRNNNKMKFTFKEKKFADKIDMKNYLIDTFQREGIKIDVMISFKFLNELYPANEGAYKAMLEAAEEILSPDGILCLVDVTSKKTDGNGNKISDWMSVYFNEEVVDYYKNNKESSLHYALPSCCAENYRDNCGRYKCFSSLEIPIQYSPKHYKRGQDTTKINYKLFMKKGEFANKFNEEYLVAAKSGCCEDCRLKEVGTCHCCGMNSHGPDGKDLNMLKGCSFENSPFSFKLPAKESNK